MSKLISIITPIIPRKFFPPAELTPDRNLGLPLFASAKT